MSAASLLKKIKKSKAFATAQRNAAEYAGDPDKLHDLIDRAAHKADLRASGPLAGLRDSLGACFRMLRAYAKREYTKTPWQSLLLIIATVAYFVMPLDFIPDFLLGLGYIDDAALIAWTVNSLKKDIDAFKDWEKKPLSPLQASSSPPDL